MYKKLLAITVSSLALNMSASAEEKDWNWFAGADDDYVMESTASILVGSMSPTDGISGNITGIELAFNCPLLQPPANKIRQQLSYAQYDEDGTEVTSIEINPHYVTEISPGLSIGAGPGLGYVSVDNAVKDTSLFALQVGGSLHYKVSDPLFLGADVRYQLTNNKNLGGSIQGMDNWGVALKAGVNF